MTLILIPLVACGDNAPKIFSDSEVPPDILNAPHAVHGTSFDTETTAPPRLGDVPSKPKDFYPDRPVWTVDDMVEDRDAGMAIRTQVQNAPDDYAQAPTLQAPPLFNASPQP